MSKLLKSLQALSSPLQQTPEWNGEHPGLALEPVYLLTLLAGTPSYSYIPSDISLPGHRELLLLEHNVFKSPAIDRPSSVPVFTK